MATRPYITRFARIVPSSKIPQEYQPKVEKKEDSSSRGPECVKFHETLSFCLKCDSESGTFLLYPMRATCVYILTLKSKSQIICSNQKLFKVLTQQGFMANTEENAKLFPEYHILDLKEISKHITGSQVVQVEIGDWFASWEDINFIEVSSTNHYALIPCVFEDKVLVEAFWRTSELTEEVVEQFRGYKLRKIDECFNVPCEYFTELFEKSGL